MAKVQGLFFALATVALVALATFYFTKPWLPPLTSDRAAIDTAIWASLLVTGVVFIATNLLLAWVSWRYQDGPGTVAAYWPHNARLEVTWTAVTAAILAVFLFRALDLWAKVSSEAPADAVLIEVTGQQFAWNVRYPGRDGVLGRIDRTRADQANPIGLVKEDPAAADDVLLLNQLYLPQGRPVKVLLSSLDVLHSFFLPQFRVKQDAVPGMTVQTWFTPTVTGDFEIACAEHCGLGHYRMRGMVHVVPAAEFESAVTAAAQ